MNLEKDEKVASKWLKEAQKGYMRIALLILLSKKSYHGYEMMKEVKDRTEGFWRPTAGGVYPILQSLEKAEYIKGEWGLQKRRRKIYRITEAGRLILDRALFKHSQIAKGMSALFEEYARVVLAVETKALPMPPVPNPFFAFLEEKHENRLGTLQIKRNRIEQMITMLQSELKTVKNKLVQLNKQKEKLEK